MNAMSKCINVCTHRKNGEPNGTSIVSVLRPYVHEYASLLHTYLERLLLHIVLLLLISVYISMGAFIFDALERDAQQKRLRERRENMLHCMEETLNYNLDKFVRHLSRFCALFLL